MLFLRAAHTLALLLLLSALLRGQITDGPKLDAAKSLVVMIEGKLGVNPTAGAGIVFAVHGDLVYIATAYHVVRPGEKQATDLKVRFWQKQTESFPAVHYPDAIGEYDLAVLQVRATGLQFRLDQLADIASLKESDKVYAIGYPDGTKRWGVTHIAGTIDDIQTLRLRVQSTYIKRGHSGGALIDDSMRLAGMVLDTDSVKVSALRIDRLIDLLRLDIKVQEQVQLAMPDSHLTAKTSKTTQQSPASLTDFKILIPRGLRVVITWKEMPKMDADQSLSSAGVSLSKVNEGTRLAYAALARRFSDEINYYPWITDGKPGFGYSHEITKPGPIEPLPYGEFQLFQGDSFFSILFHKTRDGGPQGPVLTLSELKVDWDKVRQGLKQALVALYREQRNVEFGDLGVFTRPDGGWEYRLAYTIVEVK